MTSTDVRMSGRSLWLLVGKALQMGSGFLFWVVAARNAEVSQVGLAAAAASAVMLCTQLGVLGTGSAVIVAVGREEDARGVLDTAFTVLLLTSLVAAGGYLLLSPAPGGSADALGPAGAFAAVFVTSVVSGTVIICLDQASIGLRHTEGSVVRYTCGGLAALGSVVLVAAGPLPTNAVTLLACWTLSSVVSCLVGGLQLRVWVGYRYRPSLGLRRMYRMVRVALPNHLLTMTERVPQAMVPLLLSHVASPTVTAYWYPAWMMAWIVFIAPVTVGLVQFADGVRHPEAMRSIVTRGIGWSLLLGGSLAVTMALLASVALGLMGQEYATESTDALRILMLGLVPYTVLQAYLAACRAFDRVGEGIAVSLVAATGVCLGTVAVGESGPTPVAWVWVTATTLPALFAAVRLPSLTRVSSVRVAEPELDVEAAGEAAHG